MAAQTFDSGNKELVVYETYQSAAEEEAAAANGSVGTPGSGSETGHDASAEGKGTAASFRADIDTSAPFESVKEAASRFGGIGFWRPNNSHKAAQPAEHESEVLDLAKLEEQAAQLEQDLILKEKETLDVLKELETTKMVVEELKQKLSEDNNKNTNLDILCPSPGFILMELKQAKRNLTQTTNDLADIRSAIESYSKNIEKERISLEKTHKRLSSNSSKVLSLEKDFNQTELNLQLVRDGSDTDISRELQRLNSETEQFKQIGEAAKSEILKSMVEIEQTKTRIKTAEIRLVAARKMKEAARATEAVALAEIKAISGGEYREEITLSYEDYSALTAKARQTEEASKSRVMEAMTRIDEANVSREEILKTVEEATEEVKISKKELEEALNRVEAANRGKLAVEEALRTWRSDHGRKRRSSHQNSTRFKNPSQIRKDQSLLDVNGLNLVNNEEEKPILRPTLSIGQILSRKLLLAEDYENGRKSDGKRKAVSLAQMLGKTTSNGVEERERERARKQLPAKRKKFGFGRISLLVAKQSKKNKKKKVSGSSMCRSV